MKTILIALSLLLSHESVALELYSERAMALFKEIQCPTCQSQTIDASESSDAEMLRSEVLNLIEDGKTDTEIKQEIAKKYGDHIVKDYSKPLMKTWAYSIIGLIVVVFFISRARQRKKRK